MSTKQVPPHKIEYDSVILEVLDSSFVEIHDGYRPWMNFTDLLRRVQQIYPEINDVTLDRHLIKMHEQGILIRYGPDKSKLPREVSRRDRTFYRINSGINTMPYPTGGNDLYRFLSFHKSSGHIVETKHTNDSIYVQINYRPTFPLYSYNEEQELILLRDFLSSAQNF
jgi:hypothetical protein